MGIEHERGHDDPLLFHGLPRLVPGAPARLVGGARHGNRRIDDAGSSRLLRLAPAHHDVVRHRRAHVLLARGVKGEQSPGCQCTVLAGARHRHLEAHRRLPLSGDVPEPEGQDVFRVGGVRVRRRLQAAAARLVGDPVRQHDREAQVVCRHRPYAYRDAELDGIAAVPGLLRPFQHAGFFAFLPIFQHAAQLQRRCTGRRRPQAQTEVGPPQGAALEVHELGIGGSREAAVPLAGKELIPGRHRIEVHLHDVAPGMHPLEVIHAVLVGHRVGPVLEEQPDPRHAGGLLPGGAAGS